MVSLMPVLSLSTRNQSHKGESSRATIVIAREGGRPSKHRCLLGAPLSRGMTNEAWVLRSLLLRILLMHLLEERRVRDVPLLLQLDQLAGTVPVLELLRHELAPRSVALRQRHRETPWFLQNRRQRHLEARPFRIGEALGERGIVVNPADAVALLQRDLGFGLAFERH